MFYVYVIYSEQHRRFYKGMTADLPNRLDEHNSGKMKSTKAFLPWILVYSETFESRIDARLREKYFKSAAGRRWLKKYFDQNDGPVVQRIE